MKLQRNRQYYCTNSFNIFEAVINERGKNG